MGGSLRLLFRRYTLDQRPMGCLPGFFGGWCFPCVLYRMLWSDKVKQFCTKCTCNSGSCMSKPGRWLCRCISFDTVQYWRPHDRLLAVCQLFCYTCPTNTFSKWHQILPVHLHENYQALFDWPMWKFFMSLTYSACIQICGFLHMNYPWFYGSPLSTSSFYSWYGR